MRYMALTPYNLALFTVDNATPAEHLAARRRELAKSKSASNGGAPAEADCCLQQPSCSAHPQL